MLSDHDMVFKTLPRDVFSSTITHMKISREFIKIFFLEISDPSEKGSPIEIQILNWNSSSNFELASLEAIYEEELFSLRFFFRNFL